MKNNSPKNNYSQIHISQSSNSKLIQLSLICDPGRYYQRGATYLFHHSINMLEQPASDVIKADDVMGPFLRRRWQLAQTTDDAGQSVMAEYDVTSLRPPTRFHGSSSCQLLFKSFKHYYNKN